MKIFLSLEKFIFSYKSPYRQKLRKMVVMFKTLLSIKISLILINKLNFEYVHDHALHLPTEVSINI